MLDYFKDEPFFYMHHVYELVADIAQLKSLIMSQWLYDPKQYLQQLDTYTYHIETQTVYIREKLMATPQEESDLDI